MTSVVIIIEIQQEVCIYFLLLWSSEGALGVTKH